MHHPFTEDLQAVLDSHGAYEFLPSGTWMAGACALLAESLHRLIPGSQLRVIGRLSEGIPDHVVLMVDDRGIPVYLDYNGVQTEADLLANMSEELPFDHLEIGNFVEDELDEVGLLWLRDTVPAFARFLQDRLGPIDVDRISIDWLDDEPMVPALN